MNELRNNSFQEGLNILVNSYKNEGKLTEIGCYSINNRLTQYLINRLQVKDWMTRHPEILDEKIERPLFIVGLPRTGTTYLQTLLSLDPANRALHHWEANQPCPPPELVYAVADPRTAQR